MRGVDTQLGKVGHWSGVTFYSFVALPPYPIVGPVVTLEQIENEVRFPCGLLNRSFCKNCAIIAPAAKDKRRN